MFANNKMQMKTVIIVDVVWKGHVPTYHQLIVQTLLAKGFEVISLSPNPVAVESWINAHLPSSLGHLSCHKYSVSPVFNSAIADGGWRLFLRNAVVSAIKSLPFIELMYRHRSSRKIWRLTANIISDIMPPGIESTKSVVFFPYLDYCFMHPLLSAKYIDKTFYFPWSGLYLHPTHMRTHKGARLSANATRIFQSNVCRSIATLDEGVAHLLENQIGKPIVSFPDITNVEFDGNLSPDSRYILEKAKGRKIISLLGCLSIRKNLLMLLDVAAGLDKEKYFFLFAGELDNYSWNTTERRRIESAIYRQPENIHFHLEYLPDGTEYNSMVKITDVLFAVYSNFYHSSNALTKAAAFKKPVIVSEGHLMAERVKRFGLGIAVPDSVSERCQAALLALSKGTDLNGVPLSFRFLEYTAMHSQEALNRAINRIVNTLV